MFTVCWTLSCHSWPMEDRTESPIAVKVEEHTQYVVLTYFQGDISSMVDAHFTRALGKACTKTSGPAAKAKRTRKTIKLGKSAKSTHGLWSARFRTTLGLTGFVYCPEDAKPCQTGAVDTYVDSQVPPPAGHLLTFNPADTGPSSWSSPSVRLGESPALSSFAYPLPPQGLSLTGQQYANSLLNLLHNDRNEMGPSMPSGSKPDLLPSWSMPQGFVEPTESGFEHGKK